MSKITFVIILILSCWLSRINILSIAMDCNDGCELVCCIEFSLLFSRNDQVSVE